MAKIVIQYDDFSHYENQIEDYERFVKEHKSNIERVKNLADKAFKKKEGKITLAYIIKYHQFDLILYTKEISEEEIISGFQEIEKEYPECFIDGLKTKPAIDMYDRKLKIDGSFDDVLKASVKKDKK